MNHQGGMRPVDGITLAKRIEWKRLDMEDAVKRLANDRGRSNVYREAVIARWYELEALRACLMQDGR